MIRLFNVSIPPATFILLLFESIFLLSAFLLATLLLADLDPIDYLLHDYGWIALSLVVVSFLLGLHFQDLYTQIRVKSRILLVQQLCMVTGIAFLAQGLISYLDSDLRVSVRVMLLGSLIAAPGLFLWRMWFGNVADQLIGQKRLVTVGSGPILTELRKWIEDHPEAGLMIEASADTPDELGALDEILRTQQPPTIVFGGSGRPDARLTHELMELQLAGYEVESAATAYEKACGRISLYSLRPEHLVYSSAFAVLPQKLFYQWVLNGVLASVCLVPVAPMLILTALLLRIFQRGPVIRFENATGLNGRVFRLYRFQTNAKGTIGKAVRKLRLDGLPQFVNVLKGDLAIVGPCASRPEYQDAIERHIPFYRERYIVRPGITGWAQTHLDRPRAIPDAMAQLEYDLYYIKNRSLGLDTLILLHTIKQLLIAADSPDVVAAPEEVSASAQSASLDPHSGR
jgi:lipopolysaccharide/colanic/teichoic acid biosynthesis glycosyltransferase